MLTGNWRQAIVDEARTWKGTRYAHKGRVKGVGVDCGGIIYQCYAPYLPLPAFPDDYPQDWAMHKDANELYLGFIMPFVQEIPQDRARAADLALFHYGRNFSHGAIATDKGTFIHAYGKNGMGTVREDMLGFFQLGGEQRAVKFFTAKDEWLS